MVHFGETQVWNYRNADASRHVTRNLTPTIDLYDYVQCNASQTKHHVLQPAGVLGGRMPNEGVTSRCFYGYRFVFRQRVVSGSDEHRGGIQDGTKREFGRSHIRRANNNVQFVGAQPVQSLGTTAESNLNPNVWRVHPKCFDELRQEVSGRDLPGTDDEAAPHLPSMPFGEEVRESVHFVNHGHGEPIERLAGSVERYAPSTALEQRGPQLPLE